MADCEHRSGRQADVCSKCLYELQRECDQLRTERDRMKFAHDHIADTERETGKFADQMACQRDAAVKKCERLQDAVLVLGRLVMEAWPDTGPDKICEASETVYETHRQVARATHDAARKEESDGE